MLLDRFTQTPLENKTRTINYEAWLGDGETITSVDVNVTPITNPAFSASVGVGPGNTQLIVTAGGGLEGNIYLVRFVAHTNLGQKKDDCLEYIVQEGCTGASGSCSQ